ncbi:MAG: hypothetical protein PHZ19_12105 [Candidatus Thermoplasmatota archaeon]|nr:hypothetical protein [Candidatus Thermoplasmatota archaeon]
MADFWLSLTPELQAALAGVLAGIVLYGLQRLWTDCPLLPLLGPDDTTRRKRLVAFVLAGAGALAIGWPDWQAMLTAFLAALMASQTAFTWAKPKQD